MSMNENQIYRILNWDTNTESDSNRWKTFLKDIFTEDVSYEKDDDNNLVYSIKINNKDDNIIKINLPENTVGDCRIYLKNSQSYIPFGFIPANSYGGGGLYRGNNLFLKAGTGGGLLSATLSNPTNELQYITVNNYYLIFTKIKDLKDGAEYDCCICEQELDALKRAILQIAVFPPNNEDANLINPFSFTLLGKQNLVSIAPYPVLSQTALRFDTYVFPYLFKKETYPECAFGIKKIQGKKYFLTKYLALQLEDEEGGN